MVPPLVRLGWTCDAENKPLIEETDRTVVGEISIYIDGLLAMLPVVLLDGVCNADWALFVEGRDRIVIEEMSM